MIVQDSESVLKLDMVIEALGQSVSDELKKVLKDLSFTKDGLIETTEDGSFATGVEKVFAAGDLVKGETTAVQCVADGMKAAEEIHQAIAID